LQDFKDLTWDAEELDASPVNEAVFNCGDKKYRLPVDLKGRVREERSLLAGALAR